MNILITYGTELWQTGLLFFIITVGLLTVEILATKPKPPYSTYLYSIVCIHILAFVVMVGGALISIWT